ncbi:MAG: DUF1847 domain-containing protein [Clostridiales Family XIII bacterium]|jgi:uncharacterized metal-binding protein|nr:DUF1847 domain-containing protein [Clostridiales Family XIII bacterium]
MDREREFCCSDCGVLNCYRQEGSFPKECVGAKKVGAKEIEALKATYRDDPFVSKLSRAAAEIEGTYYGKLTRVEEIIAFARRIGAEKIGIASCIGLMGETRTFTRILDAHRLSSYCAICKVGSIDKAEVGVPEEMKLQPSCFEGICNPVLQAKILNREKTGLNVLMGLCVGHDSLFIKYSKAPVTTLVTKDRVLGHNPAAALYNTGFYYKRLLQNQDI